MAFADELDKEAEALERVGPPVAQVPVPPQQVQQQQVQQQQQQGAGSPPDDEKEQ